MKLSEPGSSSDLDIARQIAHRLHELRKADEGPPGGPPSTDRPARVPLRMPSPPAPGATPPRATPRPAMPGAESGAPRPDARLQRAGTPAAPQKPVLSLGPTLEPDLSSLPGEPAAPPWDDRATVGPPEAEADDALSALADEAAVEEAEEVPGPDAAIEIEDSGATIEEIVGPGDLPSVDDVVHSADFADAEASAETQDDALVQTSPPAASPFDDGPSPEYVAEELFDTPQAPPSWGEVVDNCLTITRSRGAMLIDPAGQLLAVSGFWPEPGAEAIASKLVAMMAKTLKDAPTRSVSAPVGSLHLTAWRVPLAEGLITTAFLGDTPLHADVRTPVDAEILRGAP